MQDTGISDTGKMNTWTNKYEFRIMALQRSGHHAIIQWMLANIKGRYCFLNNCIPGKNPFHKEHIMRSMERRFVSNIPDISLEAECNGDHRTKDFLVYNYENRSFDGILNPTFAAHRDACVGKSLEQVDIIVLRDPFNNIASKLKLYYNRRRRLKTKRRMKLWFARHFPWLARLKVPVEDELERRLLCSGDIRYYVYRDIRRFAAIWKSYAEAAAGRTRLFENLCWISYNRWCSDIEYRREISESLRLNSHDLDPENIPIWGGGSSFDKFKFDGRPHEMKVHERWKHFEEDELFRSVVRDHRMHELSRELFGEIEGTASLLD